MNEDMTKIITIVKVAAEIKGLAQALAETEPKNAVLSRIQSHLEDWQAELLAVIGLEETEDGENVIPIIGGDRRAS